MTWDNNKENIFTFCDLNKLPFYYFGGKQDGKYSVISDKATGWQLRSFSENIVNLPDANKVAKVAKVAMINITNKFFVLDADTEEANDLMIDFLKDNNIDYYSTPSHSNVYNGKSYKNHYWFKYDEDLIDNYEITKKVGVKPGLDRITSIIAEPKGNQFIKNIPTAPEILMNSFFKQKLEFKPIVEEVDKQLNDSNFGIEFHRELMTIADDKYKRDFEDWVKFTFMCKNENPLVSGDYFKLWRDYSNYDKYKKSNNERIKEWENFKLSDHKKVTFKTLSYELKLEKPQEFNAIIKKYIKVKVSEEKEYNKNFWDMMALFNNADLAEYYNDITTQKFIYCNNIWYAYNEFNVITKLSEKTPSQLISNISEVLRTNLKNEIKKIEPEDKKFDSMYKLFKTCYKSVGSSSFVKGVVDFLQTYYEDNKLNEKLDNNSNLLAFTDKLYDFKTHQFRNIEMNDFISITTGYKAPTVSDPKIEQEIKNIIYSVFENELMCKYWLESVSMSIYTNKFENFYIHTGSGRNGKGLLFSLIESALGKYISTADSEFLTTRIESGKPNPVLSKAKGKRFLMISEPSTEDNKKNGEIKMNVDLIKKLSGLDAIEARDLFQKSDNVITYKPQFTCFLQCNQKPELGKLDNGIKERLKIIDYPFTFVDEPSQENERKKDMNLKDKLTSQEYINEMILLLIKTCKNFTKFNIPETVFESNNEYFGACDPIKEWLYNNYTVTKNSSDKIRTTDLLKHFTSENHHMISSKFINYMKFHNVLTKILHGNNYFVGIKQKAGDLDV